MRLLYSAPGLALLLLAACASKTSVHSISVIRELIEVRGGLSKDDVDSVFQRNRLEIRKCYDSALKRKPTTQGKVIFAFNIQSTGTVSNLNTKQGSTGDEELEMCLKSTIEKWIFPKSVNSAETEVVAYPIYFNSAKKMLAEKDDGFTIDYSIPKCSSQAINSLKTLKQNWKTSKKITSERIQYMRTLQDELRKYWKPFLKNYMATARSDGSAAPNRELKTSLIAKVDSSGTLADLCLISSSGIEKFDQAGFLAFKRSSVPTPPEKIIESDGLAWIDWDFIVEFEQPKNSNGAP